MELKTTGSTVRVLDETKFMFEINSQGRGYELQANSKKEMNDWVDALEVKISTLPGTQEVKSRMEKLKSRFSMKPENTSSSSSSTSSTPTPSTTSENRRGSLDSFIPARIQTVLSPSSDSSSSSPQNFSSVNGTSSGPAASEAESVASKSQVGNSNSSSAAQGASSNPSTTPTRGSNTQPTFSSAGQPKFVSHTPSDAEVVVKKGLLKKRGEMNPTFKDRTFILRKDGQLDYYDDKMVLKGSISLVDRSYLISNQGPFEFKLLSDSPNGREYVLRAESKDDLVEWIQALSICMSELRERARMRTSMVGLESQTSFSFATGTLGIPLREGILQKKGEFAGSLWRDRKFQLFATCLVYSEPTGKVKGRVMLADLSNANVHNEETFEFRLNPVDPTGRYYFLRGKSKVEMDGWIVRINEAIQTVQSPQKGEDSDGTGHDLSMEDVSPPSSPNGSFLEEEVEELVVEERGGGGGGSNPKVSLSKSEAGASKSSDPPKGAISPAAVAAGAKTKLEQIDLEPLDQDQEKFDLDELPEEELDLEDLMSEDESYMDNTSKLPTKRPKWVPDSKYQECMDCKIQFSLFVRKHHCRNCGRLLCDECTPNFLALPHLGYNSEVRVCIRCVDRFYRNVPKKSNDDGCLIS